MLVRSMLGFMFDMLAIIDTTQFLSLRLALTDSDVGKTDGNGGLGLCRGNGFMDFWFVRASTMSSIRKHHSQGQSVLNAAHGSEILQNRI